MAWWKKGHKKEKGDEAGETHITDKQHHLDKYLEILRNPKGSNLMKHAAGKKALVHNFQFVESTYEIIYQAPRTNKPFSLEVYEIREIRKGASAVLCKDFKQSQDLARVKPELAFTILYGNEFRLKQLCLVADSQQDYLAWTDALQLFTFYGDQDLYRSSLLRQRWLERNWSSFDKLGKGSITVKEVKAWMNKVNVKMAAKELKDLFNLVDKYKNGTIVKANFFEMYHIIMDQKSVNDEFKTFSSDLAKNFITVSDLKGFFQTAQRQNDASDGMMSNIIQQYGQDGNLAIPQFVEYLHSVENTLWSPSCNSIYMDMDRPLAHYFISSSHNTYLMGDQFRSESSTEAYIRCLRDGCRCIEIDCWDGPNTEPIVYHGHTLTSKIKFRDVLPAVAEFAFVSSDYPLIISIENHCSLAHQKVMAELFVTNFSPNLISEPPPECNEPNRNAYPSPNQLKQRIIIKHKKLTAGSDEILVSAQKDEDLSSSLCNSFLYIEDKLDGQWTKHYFVLTTEKLSISEPQEEETEQTEENAEEELETKNQELHFNEAWFHGKLKGGRAAAEALLRDVNGEDGTFLIRESDTFPGEFSMSFLKGGEVQHCRIRCQNDKYFLTDQISFVSLYELVEYYKREPLKSADFRLALKEACPQPAPHQDKKWFHKELNRYQAEEMLKRIHADGAFLIRESETSFAISFRAEGKIKHCRIRKEGRLYCIGDAEFESLVKLVEYYEKKPLYRKMKLRYPVDDALLAKLGEKAEEDTYISEDLYQEPNAFQNANREASSKKSNLACRALYDYVASRPDELSFPKDVIITNVQKHDGEWWRGDYKAQIAGWFPANYVEEVDLDALVTEEKDDKDNPLGSLEKYVMNVPTLKVEPRPSTAKQRLVFRITDEASNLSVDVAAETEVEMTQWMERIKEATQRYKDQQEALKGGQEKLQVRMRIAKELSDLIYYAQSVTFKSFEDSKTRPYMVMSSFAEKKAMALCADPLKGGQPMEYNSSNLRQFSRVYPNGKRVDSSNFDPQPLWNIGVQMAALNYQTPDKPMWLNSGRFLDNGRCGYVLKPSVMFQEGFNPFDHETYTHAATGVTLKIRVISGRHLIKTLRGIASPLVEIEILGTENDSQRYKTSTSSDNGFNPSWIDGNKGARTNKSEMIEFQIGIADLACVRFVVYDEDVFGDSNAIAQACFPIGTKERPCLRSGYRSIPLKNIYNEPLELASLLVYIEVVFGSSEEYQSLEELRDLLRQQKNERDVIIAQKLKGQTLDASEEVHLKEVNKKVNDLHERMGRASIASFK